MLRRERRERAKHNFQPKFATSTTVESKLKITSDPTDLFERLPRKMLIERSRPAGEAR